MRFLSVIGIIFLVIVENSESATQASCITSPSHWTWLGQKQSLKTCWPNISEVDEKDFTISSARDPTTFAFIIRDKKEVKFPPTNLWRVFPELVTVAVWNCSVTTVNENHFKGLTKLQHLTLRHNKIENIASDAFVDLVSLGELGLGYNRIQILGKHTFASLTALKELHLHDNEIQLLHPNVFSSLVNVGSIKLDRNVIHSLDENIFENLTSLLKISLSANKFEKIPMNLFKKNLKLTHIWFDDNRIKFIDGNMFDHLSSLNYVDLDGNLCLNKYYRAGSFGDMRNNLKQNCAENPIQDTLERLELTLENSEKQKADMLRQLDSNSREIKSLQEKLDAMKTKSMQTNQALENSLQDTLENKKKEIAGNTKSLTAMADVLKSIQLKFEESEKKNAELRRKLDSKSEEIKALEGKFETLKREIWQTNEATNYEVLSKRVDAVNETALGVVITFCGNPNVQHVLQRAFLKGFFDSC